MKPNTTKPNPAVEIYGMELGTSYAMALEGKKIAGVQVGTQWIPRIVLERLAKRGHVRFNLFWVEAT